MNLKKHLVSFKMCLLICAFLIVSQLMNAQTTVVGWDGAAFTYQGFDNTAQIGTNPYANTGITGNTNVSFIQTFGGVSPCTASDGYGDGNQIIFNLNPGTGWINGSGTKGYSFSFVSTGYSSLKFSGKFGGTTISQFKGARDFKLQYSLDNSTWTDVTGATVQAAGNTGATPSALFNAMTDISIPSACDNKSIVYMRVIMTSNTSPDGQTATAAGQTYIDDFKITGDVISSNSAPTNIALSATSINENVSANSAVGTLSSTDADMSNTFTYSLVAGTGSTDNSAFSITGNSLTINASPDFETKSSYSVRIRTTDQGSLTFEKIFTITVNNLCDIVLTSASQTNIACNGGSTGAATVNAATGGTGPYTYNWTPGTPTGDGTVSVTGLTPGVWTCTVTDANSCTATQSFTITQPTAISTATAAQTNVSCNGGSNASASVTPSGGAGGYTYSWSPSGGTAATATGLSAGTYTVTVTDANACTATRNFTITQPTAISTATAAQTNVSCNGGSNGSASVTPSGGAGGYTYSWSPSGGTAATATGLSAGTYTVTVTDANACTATRNFTITQPTAISTATAAQTNVSCNGGSNGSASVTPSGGAGGYTYSWSPSGGTSATATGLSAGTYTVTVTDANACTATRNFTITQPTTISTATAAQTNVSCNGGSNGSASVTPSGGAGGYTYSWSPSGGTAATATGLSAGTYTVTVTDANACTVTRNFTITQPNALATPTITATSATTFCSGGNVILTSSAASSYLWSNGATTRSITANASGTFTVTVSDGICTSASSNGTIVVVNPLAITPIISAVGTSNFCTGGSVTLTSTPSTTYRWSTGATTQSIVVSTSGLYTVAVNNGTCNSLSSVARRVTVNAIPSTPTISTSGATSFCTGKSVTLTSSSASGNLWSNGANTQSITVATAGTYTVAVTNLGCSSDSSSGIIVTVNPIPTKPTITTSGSTTFCTGGSVTLTSSSTTGNLWSTGATTPSITVSNAGTYTVAVNDGSCSSATSTGKTITVNTLPPSPTITPFGPTTFNIGGSVILTSSSATVNKWSTGETTRSITVTNSGIYTVIYPGSICNSAPSQGVTVTVNN